jgi:hypothetical protein
MPTRHARERWRRAARDRASSYRDRASAA